MIIPNITSASKPNRLTETKDEDYHVRYGRYILNRCNNSQLYWNLYKYWINYNFYKDKQWIFAEDLEPFLRDEAGPRNRIQWEYNIFRSTINKYVGQAISTQYKARAYNASPQSSRRKARELANRLNMFYLSEQMPLLKDMFVAKFNLGQTPEETEQKFNDEFIDYTALSVNTLLRRMEQVNEFDYLKETCAFNKSCAGISILKNELTNGESYWRPIEPAYFLYDTTGNSPSGKDWEFMGDFDMLSAPDIFMEKPTLTQTEMDALEAACQSGATSARYIQTFGDFFGYPTSKLPRYNLQWQDTDKYTYGYVKNSEGFLILIKLSDVEGEETENDDEKEYTITDVVPRSQLPEHIVRKWKGKLKENGTVEKQCDHIRYVSFVPAEVVGTEKDVVLAYGILPYQESYAEDIYKSEFSYKVDCYMYKFGELVTPVDSLIKPQRLLNRILSMSEAILNQTRGAGVFIDKSLMADEKKGEMDIQKKMNKSQAIGVDASRYGGSVQNAVVPYGNTESTQSASQMINIVEMLRKMGQGQIGMGDDMLGTGESNRKLVRVQENNIMQGNMIQSMFYHGLERMWLSVYKSIANRTRRYYADNEVTLYDTFGDTDLDYIQFSKNMKYEEMQISFRVVDDDELSIEKNNANLIQLYQLQLIGEDQFADLFNCAETDQVAYAILQYTKQKAATAAQAQQVQAQQYQDQMKLEQDKINVPAQAKQMVAASNEKIAQQNNATKINKDIISGTNKIMIEKMRKANQQPKKS